MKLFFILFIMGLACCSEATAGTLDQPKRAESNKKVLIIGAAGAIGKQLTEKILKTKGPGSVIAALRKTPLSKEIRNLGVIEEFGVDLTKPETLKKVIDKWSKQIDVVWNLAAPLSVETDKDPNAANDVTVKGF